MNGSIGVVKQILYEHPEGSTNDPSYLPTYFIAEFPQSTIPANKKYFPDNPSTWVLIPVVTEIFKESVALYL